MFIEAENQPITIAPHYLHSLHQTYVSDGFSTQRDHNTEITLLHTKPWIPGDEKSIFTVVIH